MFIVGDQVRDKRTGEVTKVDGEEGNSLHVRWSDGIEREHPLTAAEDTFEKIEMPPEEAPGAVTAQPADASVEGSQPEGVTTPPDEQPEAPPASKADTEITPKPPV